MALRKIRPRWSDIAVVAGSGPSLTEEVAEACRGFPLIAINDAYRRLPFADVLYACDGSWWDHHRGACDFSGEKWSSHGNAEHNDKRRAATQYGLNLIHGRTEEGFCLDPEFVHYGEMSGAQAVQLAGHFLGWMGLIVLVGFDMQPVNGRRHFFGEHPANLRSTIAGPHGSYAKCVAWFERAYRSRPTTIDIVNCAPGSALNCIPFMDLRQALKVRDVVCA